MSNKLKQSIQKVFDAPPPDREKKEIFLRTLPCHNISTAKFILSQIPFIKKSIWFLSVALLLPTPVAAYFVSENTVWIISSFIPLLALLLVTESTKSAMYGMNELEMASRFSLRSVFLARLSILGFLDLIIFVAVAIICYIIENISLVQTVIYLFAPYLLTANIGLYLNRRFRNKEALYLCIATAVMISMFNSALHYMADFVFEKSNLFWWVTITLFLIFSLIRELYNTLKKSEEFIWNFALTD